MRVLGLTGSIGMGKSTTAKLFAEAGVPVYDADATVHRIYEGEAAPLIEAAFPGTTADGKVDRAKLSAQVVHQPEAMQRLEQIVHPLLRAYHENFLNEAERSGAPVAVVDVPLLFETGGDKRVDAVVVVSTDPGHPARADPGARRHDAGKTRRHPGAADAGRGEAPARRFRGGYLARAGAGARGDPGHP